MGAGGGRVLGGSSSSHKKAYSYLTAMDEFLDVLATQLTVDDGSSQRKFARRVKVGSSNDDAMLLLTIPTAPGRTAARIFVCGALPRNGGEDDATRTHVASWCVDVDRQTVANMMHNAGIVDSGSGLPQFADLVASALENRDLQADVAVEEPVQCAVPATPLQKLLLTLKYDGDDGLTGVLEVRLTRSVNGLVC